MKTTEESPVRPAKKMELGAAGLSLFLHLGLFLLIGGAVVVQYAVPRHSMEADVTPVVESDEARDPSDDKVEPISEPDAAVPNPDPVPRESSSNDVAAGSMELLTTPSMQTSFQVPAGKSMSFPGQMAEGTGNQSSGGVGKAGGGGKLSSAFGNPEKPDKVGLEGYLYDLKQSKGRAVNSMTLEKYYATVQEFLSKDWDRALLADYFKVKTPLYNSQIYMQNMEADAAPKAFHVEKSVQPSQWVILYDGYFESPRSMQVRLAGFGDDILVVRINGKVVLDASLTSANGIPGNAGFKLIDVPGQTIEWGQKLETGPTVYSDWLMLKSGQKNHIEILVGEAPGGFFFAYLFVERKGETYKTDNRNRLILPIFRMADTDTESEKGPQFEKNGPVFEAKDASASQ